MARSQETYLDFDELFDTIDDYDVLIALRRPANHNDIPCSQPSSVRVPHDRFRGGLDIVHVPETNAWRLYVKLARRFELGDFCAIRANELASGSRYN